MVKKYHQVGVVLAGGGSTRFGSEKAFASYNGKPFYQHILNSLSAHVDQIVIVSRPDLHATFVEQVEGKTISITDVNEFAGKGPLAGIYSAIAQYHAERYLVVAVDMPNVHSEAVRKLLEIHPGSAQAVIPVVQDRIQPLFAQYRSDCLPILKKQLEDKNYRMIDFIKQLETQYVTETEIGIEADCFLNINDQATFKRFKNEGK